DRLPEVARSHCIDVVQNKELCGLLGMLPSKSHVGLAGLAPLFEVSGGLDRVILPADRVLVEHDPRPLADQPIPEIQIFVAETAARRECGVEPSQALEQLSADR